ncbi:GerAB/ArcD/ProY family transporter [Paenibacillus sp. S150]|uniref:GerAB/ArcD/ProY family transporter n=1 Tax=Paenibacillus sp. S150 TaxID=2749826 RepID=UPI001C562D75|nr:GerAB/ArcD/ProY family transporter [Paenibacillus sp. S150]MBW4083617.1 GerAB/ArcD/ProY family transporter [Paenibacillus sp. S150]
MKSISPGQLVMLMSIYLYSETAGFLSAPIAKTASYNAVVSLCLGACMGYVIMLFSTALARLNLDEYFAVFGKYILGKWLHYPLIFMLIAYCLHRASMTTRNLGDFLLVNHLPTTPEAVILVLVGTGVAFTVRAGVQAIARVAEVLFFINILLFVMLTPLLLGVEIQIPMVRAFVTNFNPVQTAAGMFQATPWFGDGFVILFLYPHLKQHLKVNRMLFRGLLISLGLILSYLIPSILAFGPALTGKMTYPVMEYVRMLRIADFIETLDPFLTILWIPAIIVKISLLIYAAVVSLARIFALKDFKPLSFSVTALVTGYSIHFTGNSTNLLNFMTVDWPAFALTMQLIPVLYWTVGKLRGKNSAMKKAR